MLACALVLGVGLSLPPVAQSAKGYSKSVHVIAGKADTVDLKGDVADILVANPSIADVGTLRSDRLYIVGRMVGDTNILAYDDAGNQLANIDVHVRVDDKNIQQTLRSFFPDEDIQAKTVRNNIVLSGTVSSPSVSNQVRDLATRFLAAEGQTLVDLMSVKGEQQVMLKVKVVEAKRSALRELGMDTSIGISPTQAAPTNSGTGLTYGGNDVGRVDLTPFGAGTLLVGGGSGPLATTLRGLERQGLINTLAEPNLTAISGETAGFLAGGEYPVPTGRDSQGNVIIEFKQFGVSLNFTPTVMNKNRIALHLSTEVSEKDSTNKVTLVDVEIDGLRVRRAETTVELASGNTIMMAGLLKSDTLDSLNGLPGAQEVPILGELFRSKSFQRNESELVIMVTPYLVKPYAEPEAVLQTKQPTVMQQQLGDMQKHAKADTQMAQAANPKPADVKKPQEVAKAPVQQPKPAFTPVRVARGEKQAPNVLAESLMRDLKGIYGKHVPENVGHASKFGYIVD